MIVSWGNESELVAPTAVVVVEVGGQGEREGNYQEQRVAERWREKR